MYDLHRWFEMKRARTPIAAITAYDVPTARAVDEAGVDMILVGDSLGMVLLGYEHTTQVTMGEMRHHVRAVARARPRAPIVADMPFLSYGADLATTLFNARKFIRAGAGAVKCEGGRRIAAHVQALIANGIPVVAHLGLNPQSILRLGSYRVAGTTDEEADALREDARALDELGVAAIVLECLPEGLAAEITKMVKAPTIGIGAGRFTDGQILVFHDLLGIDPGNAPPPKFLRRFADLHSPLARGIAAYVEEVRNRTFPSSREVYGATQEAPSPPLRVRGISELREALAARSPRGRIGFVPTMGALHAGHVSLVARARSECATVVASIYVNPTQFAPTEDLKSYPRDLDGDVAKLAAAGCDIVFLPDDAAMYPDGEATRVTVGGSLTKGLCGASRPGHFTGVATVVLKLLNLVRPHRAYFGWKDAQQVQVIRRMAADLFLETEIVPCPTVREADGLAMSSRNVYLTPEERKKAGTLFEALREAKAAIEAGKRDPDEIEALVKARVERVDGFAVEYAAVVAADTLGKPRRLAGQVLVLLAARLGKARLIDNVLVSLAEETTR